MFVLCLDLDMNRGMLQRTTCFKSHQNILCDLYVPFIAMPSPSRTGRAVQHETMAPDTVGSVKSLGTCAGQGWTGDSGDSGTQSDEGR